MKQEEQHFMESKLRKSILYDVIDGIPPSSNETDEDLMYRKKIEENNLALEEEAMNLGISRNIIEFTEDFRQKMFFIYQNQRKEADINRKKIYV